MIKRLSLLFAPLLLAVVTLLILDSIHPSVDGAIVLKDTAHLGVVISKPVHLESLNLLTEVVIRNTPITIEADQINVQGVRGKKFRAIRLEPLGKMEVSHDLPEAKERRLSFVIDEKRPGDFQLRHEPAAEGDGFYLYLSTPGNSESEFKMLYEAGTSKVDLYVKGSRILNIFGDEAESIVEVSEQDNLHLALSSTGNESAIRFMAPRTRTDNFLNVRYILPKDSDEVPIFSETESENFPISKQSYVQSKGAVELFVDGVKSKELNDVVLTLESDNATLQRGIQGTKKGLNASIDGTFSYVGLVPKSDAEDVNNDGRNLNSRGNARPLLPTLLSTISGFYAIVFGAIAYLIDKLITVYKFITPAAND